MDKPVYSAPPTEGLSYSSGTSAGDLSPTVSVVPAPIVADPSVPDPVPGDSSHASPVIIDSSDVSGLSILPISLQKVYGLDVSQLSSGSSGLFTPAQRSDGGTPVLLEDETAEPPTILHDGADKCPETPSTPPQAHAERSSIERLIVGKEDGGSAENRNIVLVDDFIEPSESAFLDDRHLGTEDVGVDDQNPVVDATQADDITPTPLDRSAKLTPSSLYKVDNPLAKDILPKISPKESPAHPDGLAVNGERLPGFPKVVEDDEDADGEADPDYSLVDRVVEEVTLSNAHQSVDEEGKLASSNVGNDIPSSMEVAPESETHPTR